MHQQGGTLAAHDITVHRGADAILERVSLTVTPGSRIGVVGPNGRGKTTLLRALAGLEELDGWLRQTQPTEPAGGLPAAGAGPRGRREPARLPHPAGRRGADDRVRGARPCGAETSRPRRSARARRRGAVGWRGDPCRTRLDSALALRRLPPRRADERPRLRRPRAPGAIPGRRRGRCGARLARSRFPRPDGRPDRRARGGHAARAPVHRRLERVRGLA